MMQISYDADARATYVRASDGGVAHSIPVSDLVMVDVDRHGAPVGVEFLCPVTHELVERVVARFPELKEMREFDGRLIPVH